MLFIFACLCLRSFPSPAQQESGDLVKITEGVYAHVVPPNGNAVGNAGIILLEHSVLVFDTHFTPEAGQALISKIRSLTPKPVRYVVNSHYHPDHTHGNQVFGSAAQIISSTNARRDILQLDIPAMNRTVSVAEAQIARMQKELTSSQDEPQKQTLRGQISARQQFLRRMSGIRIQPPVVTLDDSLVIVDGSRKLEILLLGGGGHTDGDVVLYIPSQRVVFAGDLFFNKAIPNVQDSNLHTWIKTLAELQKLDADKFVPGHGPVAARKDFENFQAYLEDLRNLVQTAVDRGDSLEQAIRDVQLPAKYSSFSFPNFFPANVQKMYSELKALRPASPDIQEEKKAEIDKRKP